MNQIEYARSAISTKYRENIDFNESIFFLGNGYMGVRGYLCEDTTERNHLKGAYLAGVYDIIKDNLTDFVNTPNFFAVCIQIDGFLLGGESCKISDFSQRLNLYNGEMCYEYTTQLGEKRVRVTAKRFLSLFDVHTAAMNITVQPLDSDMEVTFLAGIDSRSCNCPISDDQTKKNTETLTYTEVVKQEINNTFASVFLKTKLTDITIGEAAAVSFSHGEPEPVNEKGFVGQSVHLKAKKGQVCTCEQVISVYTSLDLPAPQLALATEESIAKNILAGYDGLLAQSATAWLSRYDDCDIIIEGDDKADTALRYNVFQMIANNARDNERVSIGARGLTHARYKGCYFWDTDIFLLPFFLLGDPLAAKNLLLYRYHALDAAREYAKKMTCSGARYPWMASFDGSEQCETWDTGACEIHITADVAYAFDYYLRTTADKPFLYRYAAEVYIETARFWSDRFSYDEVNDCYNMLFVKGPDEYCGVTRNNTYTTTLAIYNLQLALAAIDEMRQECPDTLKNLLTRLNCIMEETLRWKDIIQKAVVLYDKQRQLYIEDELFLSLEPFDFARFKTDNKPVYHRLSFDRLQRYQVLKQADIILLMALLPEKYTHAQKLAAWNFYEPLTLHDSTLSFGTHALLAAQIGEQQKAEAYLNKSMYLDLENVMCNTASEGLHLAAFGATWQSVVHGFCGITIKDGKPTATPHLPEQWKRVTVRLSARGKRFHIAVTSNGYTVQER